jgi:hypothetical protein
MLHLANNSVKVVKRELDECEEIYRHAVLAVKDEEVHVAEVRRALEEVETVSKRIHKMVQESGFLKQLSEPSMLHECRSGM